MDPANNPTRDVEIAAAVQATKVHIENDKDIPWIAKGLITDQRITDWVTIGVDAAYVARNEGVTQ